MSCSSRLDPSRQPSEPGKLPTHCIEHRSRQPDSNGTTHFLFEPLDLLARLAALIPRPRDNLIRYHGVFAPNTRLRQRIVPAARRKRCQRSQAPQAKAAVHDPEPPGLAWAERLKRAFEVDVSVCPLCGGTLRVIADVTEPDLIERILSHIEQTRAPPTQVPRRPAPTSTSVRPRRDC